jgi:transcriptional regulator with PAS, ATPase and Fis domain
VEASLIGWALAASQGNKSKAAELLLIKRSTLCDRIRKLRRNSGSDSAASAADLQIS